MKRLAPLVLILFLALAAPEALAQTPQIGAAVNGGSFDPSGVLAPGVIFSPFGTDLTDGRTLGAPSTPLPTQLAGARLLVNGIAAPLFFASPLQINAQFPVELAGVTSASIQVEVQTEAGMVLSPAITVSVEPFSPGIFTLDANGSGPGSILRNSDFSRIAPPGRSDFSPNPAVRGEVVAIFMTGLGQVAGPWPNGQPAGEASSTVTTAEVTIGGVQAEVLFSGLTGSFVALYQVNVRVPSNAPTGDHIALSLSIGGRTSNEVTIAIAQDTGAPVAQGGGPPGGDISSIVIDPSSPSTLYALTRDGDLFKSNDRAQSWSALPPLPNEQSIEAVVIDPVNTLTLYAATASTAFFKSDDGGQNWSAVASLPGSSSGGLAIDPINPTTLFAGYGGFSNEGVFTGGVARSTDGGLSWTNVSSGLPNSEVYDLAIHPSVPTIVFAATAGGVFKSTDNGENWIDVNAGLPDQISISVFAIDPANSDTVYVGGGDGVFKSIDGGRNWFVASSGLVDIDDLSVLVIDPSNSATLYLGNGFGTGGDVFKSTDGGQSWTAVNSGLPNRRVDALAMDPSNPTTLYAGTFEAGVFRTTDGGTNWAFASSGITNAGFEALAIAPSTPVTLYAATGIILKSTDEGQSWFPANAGLEETTDLGVLAIDPNNPAVLFVGTDGGIFKSSDGGFSWAPANSGLPTDTFLSVRAIAIDPNNSATVYGAISFPEIGNFKNTGIFKSTQRGPELGFRFRWPAG